MFWCLVLGHPATLRDPRSPCAQERLWVPRTAQGRLGAGRCESLQLEKTAARFFLPGNPDLCQEGEVPTGPPPKFQAEGRVWGDLRPGGPVDWARVRPGQSVWCCCAQGRTAPRSAQGRGLGAWLCPASWRSGALAAGRLGAHFCKLLAWWPFTAGARGGDTGAWPQPLLFGHQGKGSGSRAGGSDRRRGVAVWAHLPCQRLRTQRGRTPTPGPSPGSRSWGSRWPVLLGGCC